MAGTDPADPRASPRAVDLVVIGGGITGLGVARLAARHGLSVALLERGDLASGTSSVSSHMLHGGLRYLEYGRLRLVREALAERAAVGRMAPGIAHPRRFLVPLYRGDRLPTWKLRAGLALYDALAGHGGLAPRAMVRAKETLALEPALAPERLAGAGIYSDVVMDDGRLAVLVARDAAAHGAVLHTYTELAAARPLSDNRVLIEGHDLLEDTRLAFHTRVVVNAAGPWVDAVRAQLLAGLHPNAAPPVPLLRPSRGTHLVYPPLTRGHGLLLVARHDRRVFFVIPLPGHALVGTTEVEVASPPKPEELAPSAEEIHYLRAELARALPGVAHYAPRAVIAGVRPLLAGAGAVGVASREHRVIADGPILTIAGGKYTTFRVMAHDTLRRALAVLRRPADVIEDTDAPLPAPFAAGLELRHVVDFAVGSEFARRVDDVLRRRTSLWLDPPRARAAAPQVAERMAQRLGWSAERQRTELAVALEARAEAERPLGPYPESR